MKVDITLDHVDLFMLVNEMEALAMHYRDEERELREYAQKEATADAEFADRCNHVADWYKLRAHALDRVAHDMRKEL